MSNDQHSDSFKTPVLWGERILQWGGEGHKIKAGNFADLETERTFADEGEIRQVLDFDDRKIYHAIDPDDPEFRAAMIELGWTPPPA